GASPPMEDALSSLLTGSQSDGSTYGIVIPPPPEHQLMPPVPHEPDGSVLAALSVLELRLTELIRSGHQTISDQLTRFQLEQTRLNATFADRDRMESAERKIEYIAGQIIDLHR